MPHREAIAPGIAADFLSRSFRADETIAIVLRCHSPTTIVQRIVTLEHVLAPRYPRGSAAQCEDFKLANPLAYLDPFPSQMEPVEPAGKHSHSERDWAWILAELTRGKDPAELTRALADRRADKPNPVYYAQRTVDVASAWLWLKDGLPIADVVTMLQVRRRFEVPDKLCSARAHEIAFTAERMITRNKIA